MSSSGPPSTPAPSRRGAEHDAPPAATAADGHDEEVEGGSGSPPADSHPDEAGTTAATRPTPDVEEDEPTILAGRYRLERRIGQGGMAEVWVADDLQLDRRGALKWLRPALASDPIVAERFRREAIAVARLNHPNIVAVHDVFEHAGRQAVVMQLVDGKSLRQLLDTQRRLGPELTIHIGAAIAGALDEAHRAGFVHRDVKPGNILVTSDGRVLLTDFGIAKGLEGSEDDLTSDNVMMGTAKYLSPEQVRGKKLDGRADLYSLGLVLYECLAGRVPFLGESDADTALARLQRDPTDLARLRPTLPTGLVDLIHETLARNPDHRPTTGHELRNALLRVDTTPPHIDQTPAEPPRRVSARPAAAARPAIPGEPDAFGSQPSSSRPVEDRPTARPGTRSTTPIAAHGSGARPSPDQTPRGGVTRGRPARGMQQHWVPSFALITTLLVVAALVVIAIALALGAGDPNPPETLIERDDATTAVDEPGPPPAPTTTEPPGPAEIVSVQAFDPDGDSAGENDELAPLALAGSNPDSGWPTLCYASQFMGGKRGVGLIVTLSKATSGLVGVDALNAPYQLEIFATEREVAPDDPDAWGESLIGTAYDVQPRRVEASVPAGSRHLLLWLREIGPDDACTSANPFRGRLGNLTFTPGR